MKRLAEVRSHDDRRPWWMVTILVAAIWLAGSLLLASVLTAQEGLAFVWSFSSAALQCAILVVVMVPVWWLLVGLERYGLVRKVLLHCALAVVLVVVWEVAYDAALAWMASPEIAELRREGSGYWLWLQAVMIYGVVVAGMVVVQSNRRLRAEERRTSSLAILMREAELRALRAQLRPHFLFNAMNSVYALIPERPEEAATMVAMLSDLMRETLELTDQSLVPLSEEVSLVRSYLGIEQVRLGDRLRASVEVSPAAIDALVPPLLLQPLVENAVHHGIAPRMEPGEVRVRARVHSLSGTRGVRLQLSIWDSGDGFPDCRRFTHEQANKEHGNGIRITRARLENQYGEDFRMVLGGAGDNGTNAVDSGCLVLVDIPFEACEVEPA